MTFMPKSVLHHRKRIQNMSETEKQKYFAGKGIDLLRSMAGRHGYGHGSDEYVRYHDGKTPDKNTTKINEQQLIEISQQVAHNYTMKAIKSSKNLQDNKDQPFASVFRKITNRSKGIARAQKILNKESLTELASDNPSNWGGWQGGYPGKGSALKGLKGSDNDKAKNMTKPAKKREDGSDEGDEIKISKEKTKVIFDPTKKETENKIDTKDTSVASSDNPKQQSKPVKQVKEMTRHKAQKLLDKAASGKKIKSKKLAKALNKTSKGSRSGWIYANNRLSMSGSTMTGGEETIYEDLLTWGLRAGMKYFKKRSMMKAKQRALDAKKVAASKKAEVKVPDPQKPVVQQQAQPQAQKQQQQQQGEPSLGPWGPRGERRGVTGPKIKLTKALSKRAFAKPKPAGSQTPTIKKTTKIKSKNQSPTGGISSDNKMSASDFRDMLKKNPNIKVKAGGSDG